MNQTEFTTFMKQYPQCADIAQFLSLEREKNATNTHYHVIDNNCLSDLAALAKNAPTEFTQLIQECEVIILPQIILEESIRNLHDTRAVNGRYMDFYRLVHASGIPIYLESMEHNFKLIVSGFLDVDTAFINYWKLAEELTSNIIIKKALQSATTVTDIDNALRHNLDDAGERIIFLYAHAMVMDKVKRVTILSNEVKEGYNVWVNYLKKSSLLSRLQLHSATAEQYASKLRISSYNVLLLTYLRKKVSSWSKIEILEFLNVARSGKVIERPIYYYRTSVKISDIRKGDNCIDNTEFLDFVLNPNEYSISF